MNEQIKIDLGMWGCLCLGVCLCVCVCVCVWRISQSSSVSSALTVSLYQQNSLRTNINRD